MSTPSSTQRPSAADIFARVEEAAEEELERRPRNLWISGMSAGLAMGVSALGVAVLIHALAGEAVPTGGQEAVAFLAYPLGFLIVIMGRQQLFTENTLFPVALVLDERRHLARTARLWALVLGGNLVGTALFATLAVHTPALGAPVTDQLVRLGVEAGTPGFGEVFWTAVVGGWIIALVAWLVTACNESVAQILVILVLTYAVGVGHFAHSIAGSGEVLSAVMAGALPLTAYLTWLAGAVLGNVAGGVLIVTLFNYGQVHLERGQDGDGGSERIGGTTGVGASTGVRDEAGRAQR